MSVEHVGSAFRAVRLRRNWTQAHLASRAKVSRWAVLQIENGHLAAVRFDVLERVAGALDGHLDLRFRWRGEELDRLLNQDHSAMHEQMAEFFAKRPEWIIAPEVTFAIYGERGVIDILAYHAATRRLLVIELKTLIVDVQQLLAVTDRYRRLAIQIARQRGWDPVGVSVWIIVANTRTNRRRIAAHRTVLRTAYPVDGRGMHTWLEGPKGNVAAFSTVITRAELHGRPLLAGRKRASPKRQARSLAAAPAS